MWLQRREKICLKKAHSNEAFENLNISVEVSESEIQSGVERDEKRNKNGNRCNLSYLMT